MSDRPPPPPADLRAVDASDGQLIILSSSLVWGDLFVVTDASLVWTSERSKMTSATKNLTAEQVLDKVFSRQPVEYIKLDAGALKLSVKFASVPSFNFVLAPAAPELSIMQLMRQLAEANRLEKARNDKLIVEMERLARERSQLHKVLESKTVDTESMRNELAAQFTVILNEKKGVIRRLEQQLGQEGAAFGMVAKMAEKKPAIARKTKAAPAARKKAKRAVSDEEEEEELEEESQQPEKKMRTRAAAAAAASMAMPELIVERTSQEQLQRMASQQPSQHQQPTQTVTGTSTTTGGGSGDGWDDLI